MKNLTDLTLNEINEIFGVIVDSQLQSNIMNEENHPKKWMLNYVFDSHLQKELEIFHSKKYQMETLNQDILITNNDNNKLKL